MDPLVQQYHNVLSDFISQFDSVIKRYQNSLFQEVNETDRFFIAEEMGSPGATGSITLTSQIYQQTVIEGFVISSQANQPVTLVIDRFTLPAQNSQSRVQLIAPVKYVMGPGKTLKMSWSGGTDGLVNYFAAYGRVIGSRFGS